MRFRSVAIPTLLILGLSHISCDDRPSTTGNATDSDVFEEKQAPKQTELEELRWRCQSFLTENNPELTVHGFNFTQLTPNVYLVGANVTDSKTKSDYVKQLSVEKMKDVGEDDDGDLRELDSKVYTIDYADPFKMAQIAERHGFAKEVRDVHTHNVNMANNYHAGYVDNWLDDYIIWSTLFNRPNTVYYGYGSGFVTRPTGYRYYAPSAPINVAATRSGFGWLSARTGGRSYAFTSGIARNPPNVTHIPSSSGAKVFSSSGGKSTSASVARGGFGGRAGGFSSGG